MKTRAIAVFTASAPYGIYRVRVRLMPSVTAVDAVYRAHWRASRKEEVRAFFAPSASDRAVHVGTIVLPADGPLAELVPHEVTHAVVHRHGEVDRDDDEHVAGEVGYLSANIFARLKRLGLEV